MKKSLTTASLALAIITVLSVATLAQAADENSSAPLGGGSLLSSGNGTSAQPIEVSADQSLEWHQEENLYVARGHATAKRGDTTIAADVLTAYNRKGTDGGSQLYKLTAEGNVHIYSPKQEAFSEHAVYDMDQKTATLTGQGLMFKTATDTVTARDAIEYHEDTQEAVARGNAQSVREGMKVNADTLTAKFVKGADGQTVIDRIGAERNVIIVTTTDVVRSDTAVYFPAKDHALLNGNVKITRGTNQLEGDSADIDFKTGLSKIVNKGNGRVHGLFTPNESGNKAKGDKGGDASPLAIKSKAAKQ